MNSSESATPETRFFRRERLVHFLVVPLLYLCVWFFFFEQYRHIFNKDEISYISIAEKYANGDFFHAVNGYWAPLLSWLLAPLLLLGLPLASAVKLLSFLVGLFVFLGARTLSYAFDLSAWLRNLLLLSLAPVLAYCSLIAFTPDFLLVGVLSFYFGVVLRHDYAVNVHAGWLSGVFGAFAYFGKSYAVYFFVAHFLLINFVHSCRCDRRAVLKRCVTGLAAFGVLTAGWVGLLHWKYQKVTLGLTGKYNYAIVGPDSPGRPIFYMGFLPPPNPTATSIWEDPYFFPPIQSWSPVESARALKHQVKLFLTNAKHTLEALQGFSVFSLTIVVAGLALCLVPAGLWREHIPIVLGLATLGLYPAGYCLVHSEARYLWPLLFLLIFMGGHLLEFFFRTPAGASRGCRALLSLAFAASFMANPLNKLRSKPERHWGPKTNGLGQLVEPENVRNAKIASNTDFGAAVCIAHRVGAKYYGQAKKNASEAQVVRELQQNGIEYYFVFDGARVESAALVKTKEVHFDDRSLAIYAIRPPAETP